MRPERRIERFDPVKHDRDGFSSGVVPVDNFFKRTANKLSKADNLRLYAMTADGVLVGFHALNAHSVTYTELPPAFARNRPAHGTLPAAFITMIGVDVRHQGRGFGSDLLVDALTRVARASQEIGIAVAMLDVLDCGAPSLVARRKSLYESFGFQSLPSRPLRLFLPLGTVRQILQP